MSRISEKKTYLGDGVYADIEGSALLLTAENGFTITDKIYLDSAALLSLVLFFKNKCPIVVDLLKKALEALED